MDEQDDSPFAHVPSPSAGPGPLEAEPLTWEGQWRAIGRMNRSGAPRSVARVVAILVVSVIVLVPLALLIGRWLG